MDMTADCIEYAPFKTRPGVTEAQLIAASDRLQEALLKLPGFRGRVLLKEKEGHWVDLVFWRSRKDTEGMGEFIQGSEACHLYFGLMEMTEGQDPEAMVTHLDRVKGYGPLGIR